MTADERAPRRVRIAAVDLGTVSSRLMTATVEDGAIVQSSKRTVITDLGEGVDATGRLSGAAIARVLEACARFADAVAAFCPDCTCTTLTSAARDAANGEELLAGLRALGFAPQVIPGEVEARLTFLGVARDFAGERIAVADSGGGSTELALGSYVPGKPLSLEAARSLDIGCRRLTERFLADDPPTVEQLARARTWAAEQFEAYWARVAERPDRLVAVGGTVTTLVAMALRLAVYDSSRVHLHALSLDEVERACRHMASLSVEQIAQLPGIQPKRARVILAGALIIAELMRAGGYRELTVSENSLLAGMASTMYEMQTGRVPAIGWTPVLS